MNLKNFPLLKYFRSIPKFLQVVGFLSDLYTYNEHVNVFISCSKKMKLRHADINWGGLNSAEVKKPLEYTHFFELARMIREECLSSKIRLAVSKRRHEAQARFDNYCDYIDLCFEKYSKLIFLRIDLHYQASIAPQITEGSKRGRKRARFESYMAHIYRLNQPSTLTMPSYPE